MAENSTMSIIVSSNMSPSKIVVFFVDIWRQMKCHPLFTLLRKIKHGRIYTYDKSTADSSSSIIADILKMTFTVIYLD